jgi:hypothetical protein
MSNKKQTAVEWLEENSHIVPKNELNKRELIEQAKEMEKQQIIDAYNNGCIHTLKDKMKKGEQYYNETYETE